MIAEKNSAPKGKISRKRQKKLIDISFYEDTSQQKDIRYLDGL